MNTSGASNSRAAQEMLGGVEQSLLDHGFTESDLGITSCCLIL
jgi:hypothetical protein